MKKKILTLLFLCVMITPSFAQTFTPDSTSCLQPIDLTLQVIDCSKGMKPHRTPVQVPNVYLNQDTNTLLFEGPCYECTLELVVPGTDTAAFSYIIPDGDDVVQLPTYLSGAYELHIHRGIFCFYATIEL